jgi:hypothetical protein
MIDAPLLGMWISSTEVVQRLRLARAPATSYSLCCRISRKFQQEFTMNRVLLLFYAGGGLLAVQSNRRALDAHC